ncbi:hypothetical protein PCC9214_05387 (plasmid) [Planktothrix tepida]|uniref:Uncharacterized protein n=1 Tax=Planktothrix tepida PCC 9214 TaxID=671072 RepID=A0A1J1LMZ1_9CYAN|nr:hypothetical protein [Planktothrix tepida]CAD5988459.1 hypothetical protein PCC9214_05387 [Planktothrix tepida]CUR33912.1 conserved hypothetical protein [Planktothrix tepida PCC 9214]
MYYGYRCYDEFGNPLGWLYTLKEDHQIVWTENQECLHWCKRWKTEQGAKKHHQYYNQLWQSLFLGGYLQVEPIPVPDEQPLTSPRQSQEKWDANNSDIIKESKAKYDSNNPIWSVRFKAEHQDILDWLNEERYDDETNQDLLIRKLRKLMKMENQGY